MSFLKLNFVKHSGMVLAAMGVLTFGAINANAEAAVVINDTGCFMPSSVSGLTNSLFTTDSHAVENSSGNRVLKCYFEIAEGDRPTKAIVVSDFLCNTTDGLTEKSHFTASPGGNAVLTCQVKAAKP